MVKAKDFSNLIELQIRCKQNQIKLNTENDQILPAVVSVRTKEDENPESENEDRAPIDLICVVDRSGSMEGEKIQLVRDTLIYLLELMGDNDRLCVIDFDDHATRLTHLARTTPENKVGLFTTQI